MQTSMRIFMCNYLLRISVTGTKQHEQKQFGEKGLYFILKGIQGGNPEAVTDTEATKESSLLACSPWLVQPAFLGPPRQPAQG